MFLIVLTFCGSQLKVKVSIVNDVYRNSMKNYESKLSYSMYLLHPMLMQIAYGNQFVVPVHFSDFKPVLMYLGEQCVFLNLVKKWCNLRFSADGYDMVNLLLFGYRSTVDKFGKNAHGMKQNVYIIYFQ